MTEGLAHQKEPQRLKKEIRLHHATAMVVGTIIGASIFVAVKQSSAPPAQLDSEPPARLVRTIAAPVVTEIPRALGYGRVEPERVWEAVAEVSGRIVETHPRLRKGAMLAAGELLVGVNTRNLRTLHVDPQRLAKLAPALPAARCVAESGLHEPADAATVAGLGYRLALVGTALMRSENPAGLVAGMRDAGAARFDA